MKLNPGLYINENNGQIFELRYYTDTAFEIDYIDILDDEVTYWDPPFQLFMKPSIVYIGEVE